MVQAPVTIQGIVTDRFTTAGSVMSKTASDRPPLRQFRGGTDGESQARIHVEASQVLARRGDVAHARRLLQAAVQADPAYAEAWLRLAWLTGDLRERKVLLRRVLALEPGQAQARAELAGLEGSPALQEADRDSSGPGRARAWLWGLALVVAAVLLGATLVWGPVDSSLAWLVATPTPMPTPLPTAAPAQVAARFVPQLEEALAGEQWERALELVAIMQGVDPAGSEVQGWAWTAHVAYGQALVAGGQVDAAEVQFEAAVALAPDDAEAQRWLQATRAYRSGQKALAAGEWPAAIEAFTQVQGLMPDYGDVLGRLVAAYRGQGETALGAEDWEVAITSLGQAHYRMRADAEIVALLSRAYRGAGQAAIAAKEWAAALETLTEGHEQLPGDAGITDLLVTAYRERGIIHWEKGNLKKARADLEAALDLDPEDKRAEKYLGKVMYELFPPKRIEVDISRQRFYAWEGDVLVYNFPTSTGLPGRDTATGHFRVLDKIPSAYSSVWRLTMPYWLGIYYVGNIENGIHALPIRPDGTVMWGGLLGQRASYGCIILSTQAARTIYNWAEVGTPVDIHY